jgi:phosphoglycolate phosphatase-like HAD superfamily hydrolase
MTCWAVTTGTHDAGQLHAARADKVFSNLNEMAMALGVA